MAKTVKLNKLEKTTTRKKALEVFECRQQEQEYGQKA